MRFDLLTASISPGVYAPLALMAGGLLVAVIALIFLFLRRRNKGAKPAAPANPVVEAGDTGGETALEMADAPDVSVEEAPVVAAPVPVGRRRSLVGGAERDQGTPSGALEEQAQPGVDIHAEPEIEEAVFDDADEAHETHELYEEVETADLDEDADIVEVDEAPETFEAPAEEAEWTGDEEEDHDLELAGAAAGTSGAAVAAVAGSVAMASASTDETVAEEPALKEPAPEELTPPEPTPQEPTLQEPVSAEVEAARKRPIVFRQFLPQSPGKDGLSFYGGQPIGPAEFQWPRERGAQGGAPLQFLMQWDCTQLSQQDPTGLLPQDGVLYCFVNCDRDDEEEFLSSHAFVHHRGPARGWMPIDIPEDAGPALGKTAALKLSGCTDQVANADDYVPRVMPRFPFTPTALQILGEDAADPGLWSSNTAASALLDVQKNGVAVAAATNEIDSPKDEMGRPFAGFPHDFGAIRVISSRMIEALQNPDPSLAEALYTQLSPEEREAQFDRWREEAKELYLLGTQRPEGQKLEPNISDDIWNWFNDRKSILGPDLAAVVVEAVDLSLSVSSEALGNVPAKWIDKAMDAHALAREYAGANGSGIHAPVPARMFGPPSFAQSVDEDLITQCVLLLELPNGSGPHHDFGGKTLQYWITPDDLAAGKFDQVTSTVIEG